MTNNPEYPDFQTLMQQAQSMQQEILRSQENLAQKTVDASAGGGMVSLVMAGNRQIKSLHIDPQVIDPKDPQMLQDLIVATVNQALQKVKQLEEDEMQKTAMGMGIPPHLL